jgi:anaerobic carbon-monoxide dehydrogenase iron sulfur subunit
LELSVRQENCSGCGTCKLACAIDNFKEVRPSKALLRIEGRFPGPGDYRIHLCDQCGECAESCPEEAIRIENEIYMVEDDRCSRCLICVDVCPRGVMMVHPDTDVPAKCTGCAECARICPRGAIVIVDQREKEVA